jgi:hypothetical protein
MPEDNTLTLKPHSYGKLGNIHCGVTYEGFVAVGGFPRDIADGEEIQFEKIGIKASRSGSEYTFVKLNQ